MCTSVMHFTNSLEVGGWLGGWGEIVDTHNWRHEHVQRDSNLEIKKQQIRWGRADMDEQRECIQSPVKGVGQTLYVICVTSMGLLCMCMFMAMMSEKRKKKDRTL